MSARHNLCYSRRALVRLVILASDNYYLSMSMTQKDMRDLVHHSPFQPFRLHLADGNNLRIRHPDFVLAGRDMTVVAGELPNGQPGEINLIPYEHIVRVEMLPGKTRKAA
jgi:hypothetical protein